ncbi:Hypothetical protein NTJ_02528 [Nesidiocoris tenuis]|uniref:Uncharacterized protein n=1 Tax=Nesidiocoris tenuis TaxID=355587 RepID=A0ABN7ABM6_9HEMI|nr:Hypothetical protein NTJ_02528 [Nesidiocoris tenuis]
MSEAAKPDDNAEAGAEAPPMPPEAPKDEAAPQPEQQPKEQQPQQTPQQPQQTPQPPQRTPQLPPSEQPQPEKKQPEQPTKDDNGNGNYDDVPSTPETERPNRPQRVYREIVEDTRAKSPSPWTNRSRMVSPVRRNGPDSPYRFAISARSRPSSRERIVRPPDR